MKTIIFTENDSIRVIADSALGRNRHPWFLPEVGHNWTWHCAPALRISRLGKGIRPEFAGRYVEERTLAWIPQADDNPAADYMDGALVIGEWTPIGSEGLSPSERDTVVSVSRFSTIKQGDVIILDSVSHPSNPININEKIQVDFNGLSVLDFTIK